VALRAIAGSGQGDSPFLGKKLVRVEMNSN